MRQLFVCVFVLFLVPIGVVHGQATDPTPEAAPTGAPLVGFGGDLGVSGYVSTGEGIVFPDGTVQTSAAGSGAGEGSLTANNGLYSNRITDFTPPLPYVEVCFKNGNYFFDIHTTGGTSTAGGDCVPGDKGWLIERDERSAAYWEDARAECLMNDMRLPEPFEFMFSCRRAAEFALIGMANNFEFASNEVVIVDSGNNAGAVFLEIGNSFCASAGWDWFGRELGPTSTQRAFRCAR